MAPLLFIDSYDCQIYACVHGVSTIRRARDNLRLRKEGERESASAEEKMRGRWSCNEFVIHLQVLQREVSLFLFKSKFDTVSKNTYIFIIHTITYLLDKKIRISQTFFPLGSLIFSIGRAFSMITSFAYQLNRWDLRKYFRRRFRILFFFYCRLKVRLDVGQASIYRCIRAQPSPGEKFNVVNGRTTGTRYYVLGDTS